MLRGYRGIVLCLIIGFLTVVVINFLLTPDVANAAMIDIRDEEGNVTTWGWWLINIFSPYFVLFEIIKIGLGLLMLALALFGNHSGFELLAARWGNLTVMFPGLVVWVLGAFASK